METREAGAVSQSCTPNGRVEQVITFSGTPQRVVVTLTAAGTDVVSRADFQLKYETVHPNGEDCEPVCRQAAESWELP